MDYQYLSAAKDNHGAGDDDSANDYLLDMPYEDESVRAMKVGKPPAVTTADSSAPSSVDGQIDVQQIHDYDDDYYRDEPPRFREDMRPGDEF